MAFLALIWVAGAVGCSESDVGRCCSVLPGADPAIIPCANPDDCRTSSGDPINGIGRDPKFDCEELTCASYRGSKAFCTKKCEFDSACPEGFVCATVLQSDPGPDYPIQPSDKFCVKSPIECTP